jgi:hypothetical protein
LAHETFGWIGSRAWAGLAGDRSNFFFSQKEMDNLSICWIRVGVSCYTSREWLSRYRLEGDDVSSI